MLLAPPPPPLIHGAALSEAPLAEASLACAASEAVFDMLMGLSAAELSALPPHEQDGWIQRAACTTGALCDTADGEADTGGAGGNGHGRTLRRWALTRDPASGLWCANACARVLAHHIS